MNPLRQLIANDLSKNRVISFKRFMELALYCPVYGYYEGEADKIGRRGDFYTSVSVGSLFGELLAFQFSNWLNQLQTPDARSGAAELQIVEAGAYHGQLAGDILGWMQTARAGLWEKLQYCIVEPSERLKQKQREMLAGFAAKVRWVSQLQEVKAPFSDAKVRGIVFSNELLDALPVRRIGWDAKARQWFEWGVSLAGTELVWAKIHQPEDPIPDLEIADEILDVLPDGFITELGSSAVQWWQEAAGILGQGKLMAIDYGLNADDFILPERSRGTLRGYSKHRAEDDLLANPGEQDLTAHVNFTAVQAAGLAAGLQSEMLVSQEKFLIGVAEQTWKRTAEFSQWNANRRRQLQTLVHPEHLGRPFRVLVQSR